MKNVSTNIFSDFEFHDAHFAFESFENGTLAVAVRFLNVHKNTEYNTYTTDMEILAATITFSNFEVIAFEPARTWKTDENGELYTDEPQVIFEGKAAEEKLLSELRIGATVFEFGTLENGTPYFEGSGDEPWFHTEFRFDRATVEWDEFRKAAWYEDLRKSSK